MEVERRGVEGVNCLVLFSSSCEFGAALSLWEKRRQAREVVSTTRAVQAVATEEAVAALYPLPAGSYRKVLLYQPKPRLAELQAELEAAGHPRGLGEAADFLDTQCITFTTAATRKEKLRGRGGRQEEGQSPQARPSLPSPSRQQPVRACGPCPTRPGPRGARSS